MTYPVLSIQEFGKHLIQSGDLDPVYIMLQKAELDGATKARWCLAYWCLYNAGAASFIAACEGAGFWAQLRHAAQNEFHAPTGPGDRWPRGKERRHWRGKQAVQSWENLHRLYEPSPEAFVSLLKARAPEYISVQNFVESHRGFGPWMSFKIADMLEQVFGVHVDFTQASVFMFKDPKEAALRYWRRAQGLPDTAKPREPEAAIKAVVDYLLKHFGEEHGFLCPNKSRIVGLQEIETILCKWKSHENGHYPLYNDIGELRHGLEPWAKVSSLAAQLLECVP
jgi:hypothetical protein